MRRGGLTEGVSRRKSNVTNASSKPAFNAELGYHVASWFVAMLVVGCWLARECRVVKTHALLCPAK